MSKALIPSTIAMAVSAFGVLSNKQIEGKQFISMTFEWCFEIVLKMGALDISLQNSMGYALNACN